MPMHTNSIDLFSIVSGFNVALVTAAQVSMDHPNRCLLQVSTETGPSMPPAAT